LCSAQIHGKTKNGWETEWGIVGGIEHLIKNPKFDLIFAPYETYLDDLLAVKTSYGAAILIRNEEESRKLAVYERYVPDIQDALPLNPADRPSKRGHVTPMEVMDAPYRAGDLRYGYQPRRTNCGSRSSGRLTQRGSHTTGENGVYWEQVMLRAIRLTVALVACRLAFGQTAAPTITFEAASVKPASSPFHPHLSGGPGTADPARFVYSQSLGFLIGTAYRVTADALSAPDWIWDQRYSYDIVATMPPDTTKDQFRLMLQNLLEERFNLRFHHENRSRPGYDLVLAPRGFKLKEWSPDTNPSAKSFEVDAEGFLSLPPRAPINAASRTITTPGGTAVTLLTLRGPMSYLSQNLGSMIYPTSRAESQPRVVDKTGLKGTFEFKLRCSDQHQLGADGLRSCGEWYGG
jgi:uncharacterized protein (TIGR03435 family)